MNNRPDYINYSLDDLYQAFDSIDKDAYPARFQELSSEIERRKSGITEEKSEPSTNIPVQEKTKPNKVSEFPVQEKTKPNKVSNTPVQRPKINLDWSNYPDLNQKFSCSNSLGEHLKSNMKSFFPMIGVVFAFMIFDLPQRYDLEPITVVFINLLFIVISLISWTYQYKKLKDSYLAFQDGRILWKYGDKLNEYGMEDLIGVVLPTERELSITQFEFLTLKFESGKIKLLSNMKNYLSIKEHLKKVLKVTFVDYQFLLKKGQL